MGRYWENSWEDKTGIQGMEGGHRVGPKQDLVLIDTNIFVIELRYKRDTNFEVNRVFLEQIGDKGNCFNARRILERA